MTKGDKSFKMKQFDISDFGSGMKVGTDGIILGAWAGAEAPKHILDIGTGSGLIALMLAQRFPNAIIHAIDIDALSEEQARYNIANSPFTKRIQSFHASLSEWSLIKQEYYDMLVCNPPFFNQKDNSESSSRSFARNLNYLPPESLFEYACLLAKPTAKLSIIYPGEIEIESVVQESGWFTERLTRVHTTEQKLSKRTLYQFSRLSQPCKKQTLYLRDSLGYTKEYRDLVKGFYTSLK